MPFLHFLLPQTLISWGVNSSVLTAGEITGPGGPAATGTVSLIGLAHTANALTQQGLHWNDPAIPPDGFFQALTNAPQPLGVPAHVVYTFDNSTPGSTVITYYRDGVLKTSATVSRNLSDIPDVNSWLGRSNWTNEPNLHGTLDEVRLYNRILVQSEVIASRAAGPDAGRYRPCRNTGSRPSRSGSTWPSVWQNRPWRDGGR